MDGFQNPQKNIKSYEKKKDFKTPVQKAIDDRFKKPEFGLTTDVDKIVKDLHEKTKDKKKSDDIKIKKKSPPWDTILKYLHVGQETSTKDIFTDQPDREIDGISIIDLVSPIDMEIDFSYIQMGDYYYRTLVVTDYPRYVEPNWLSPIINFDHSLRISTFYYPVDTKVSLDKLKKKIGELEATLYMQVESHKPLDPKIKVALNDAQQFQDESQRVRRNSSTTDYILQSRQNRRKT
jgi:hypothetical protein